MNKGVIIFGIAIMFAFLVSALDFTPQGNINLRNVFNITNGLNATFVNVHGVNITATFFKGDGSLLTALPGVNASFNESRTNDLYLRITGGDITGNVNFTGKNVTNLYALNFSADVAHRAYSNGTCVIINGDTSTLNIC